MLQISPSFAKESSLSLMMSLSGSGDDDGGEEQEQEEDDESMELNLATYLGLLENAGEDDEYQSVMFDKDSASSRVHTKGTIRHFSGENSLKSEYCDDNDDSDIGESEQELSGNSGQPYEEDCFDSDDYENELNDDNDDSTRSSVRAISTADIIGSRSDSVAASGGSGRHQSFKDGGKLNLIEDSGGIQDSTEGSINMDSEFFPSPNITSKKSKIAGFSKESAAANSNLNKILGDQIERLKQIRLLNKEASDAQVLKDRNALTDARSREMEEGANIWDIMCGGEDFDASDDERRQNADSNMNGSESEEYDRGQKADKNTHTENVFRELQNNEEDGYFVDIRKNKNTKKKQKNSVVLDGSTASSVGNNKFDVEERHRAKLIEIAAKRKQDDDDAIHTLEKANAKRKKFKEALLEKALKTRTVPCDSPEKRNGDVLENNPKKYSECSKNSTVRNRNASVCTVVDMEEQKKAEDERFNEIAMIRRKFKEQHKNILISLMKKQKEEEKKTELLSLAEKEKKRRRKLKAEKILAKKAEAIALLMDPLGTGVKTGPAGPQGGQNLGGRDMGEDRVGSVSAIPSRRGSGIAVGSGLAGVRAHRAQSAEVYSTTNKHRHVLYVLYCDVLHYLYRTVLN